MHVQKHTNMHAYSHTHTCSAEKIFVSCCMIFSSSSWQAIRLSIIPSIIPCHLISYAWSLGAWVCPSLEERKKSPPQQIRKKTTPNCYYSVFQSTYRGFWLICIELITKPLVRWSYVLQLSPVGSAATVRLWLTGEIITKAAQRIRGHLTCWLNTSPALNPTWLLSWLRLSRVGQGNPCRSLVIERL